MTWETQNILPCCCKFCISYTQECSIWSRNNVKQGFCQRRSRGHFPSTFHRTKYSGKSPTPHSEPVTATRKQRSPALSTPSRKSPDNKCKQCDACWARQRGLSQKYRIKVAEAEVLKPVNFNSSLKPFLQIHSATWNGSSYKLSTDLQVSLRLLSCST